MNWDFFKSLLTSPLIKDGNKSTYVRRIFSDSVKSKSIASTKNNDVLHFALQEVLKDNIAIFFNTDMQS